AFFSARLLRALPVGSSAAGWRVAFAFALKCSATLASPALALPLAAPAGAAITPITTIAAGRETSLRFMSLPFVVPLGAASPGNQALRRTAGPKTTKKGQHADLARWGSSSPHLVPKSAGWQGCQRSHEGRMSRPPTSTYA